MSYLKKFKPVSFHRDHVRVRSLPEDVDWRHLYSMYEPAIEAMYSVEEAANAFAAPVDAMEPFLRLMDELVRLVEVGGQAIVEEAGGLDKIYPGQIEVQLQTSRGIAWEPEPGYDVALNDVELYAQVRDLLSYRTAYVFRVVKRGPDGRPRMVWASLRLSWRAVRDDEVRPPGPDVS